MGTSLQVAIRSADRSRGFQIIEAGFNQVRVVDSAINDWKDDSELSRLNLASPGDSVPVSPALFALLEEVSRWSRETGGAFDPAIGALIDVWGFRTSPRRPDPSQLAAARNRSGIQRYRFIPATNSIRLPLKNSWIDAGGFGKGAALRAARAALIDSGVSAGVMDFGGQVLAFGDTTWRVGVAHPRQRDRPVTELLLRDASASTSSQSEHYIEIGGERLGHVLDPRTGRPIPAWGSVTVVHPDPMVADLLSTALLVMGPERGLRWAQSHRVAALFLIDGGDRLQFRWTAPLEQYLASPSPHSTGG